MNISELKELIDFLRENGVSEFESNENGKHIKLSLADFKNYDVSSVPTQTISTSKVESTLQKVDNIKEVVPSENLTCIKSPIVGTFYSKPSPEAQPFVKVGDKVKKGQVLCIIEAMKVMNEIESSCDGVIEEICANDAEIVEFSQVLFKIK